MSERESSLRDGRRVVIVSPFFPPSTLAGVHRARLLARHLPAAGWEPVVVCVDERTHEEPLDPGLLRLVAPETRVVRVGAAPTRLSRACGLGDLSIRGWLPLRAAIHRLLEREQADVVLITVGPFYSAMLAGGIRRRFGMPVVLDYQDPWVSRWGAGLPRGSKGGWSHRLATALEPRALRSVDWITAVSRGTYEEILGRHAWIDPARCTAIPIGGDTADFDDLPEPGVEVLPPARPGELRISYVGTLLPRAESTLRALFRAVRLVQERSPGLGCRLRFTFVGTSNQPAGGPARVAPIAAEEGVAELVHEVPRRVPYLEALAVLSSSDLLLALGSDEPHYTASKIYPVLLSGRPGLALFHEASSVCDVVRSAGGALLITYGEEAPALSRVEEIAGALESALRGPATVPAVNREALAPFLAPAIAAKFAEVFSRVAAEGPRGLGR